MLLAHAIGSIASNSIAFFLSCWLSLASDSRSNVQQQKIKKRNSVPTYIYLTLSTYLLSYMYANLQSTFLHIRKYFVKISML